MEPPLLHCHQRTKGAQWSLAHVCHVFRRPDLVEPSTFFNIAGNKYRSLPSSGTGGKLAYSCWRVGGQPPNRGPLAGTASQLQFMPRPESGSERLLTRLGRTYRVIEICCQASHSVCSLNIFTL